MPSSSSSSHLIPTSFSKSWKYDVFMSFRGEDTRKTFVDHLYSALEQQGIYTYKDDETLSRGMPIGRSLLNAIQESRIIVIVFSKNYADSSWCLDALECIIECMDKRGQIVMPVFYDVDPSDVRKQNGKFEEAFAKHESEYKHKVESWRRALVKAGNLSGWVPKDFANGHEAKCIKDIVGKISSRLLKSVNKDLIGIETRLQDLKSKMEIGSGGVRMVGIWGVGGGGKTTLASVAYTEISHQFEAHCILENIRDESRKLIVSLDMHRCFKLKSIACNFNFLKRLEDLNFFGCSKVASQDPTSLKKLTNHIGLQFFHQDSSVNLKFAKFPQFLRRLSLSYCNLGDADIPSDICDLVNLQILDLSGNHFSQLHSSLSRIPCLKFLNLSQCTSLVKLFGLPSSIAILAAFKCDSLESIGELSAYKWLWKVSLWNSNKLTGGGRVLHSMLQRSTIEDRFMSVTLPSRRDNIVFHQTKCITLQLSHNWHSEFTGFLVTDNNYQWQDECIIVIKLEMFMDSKPDRYQWEKFDKYPESFEHAHVCYVPFGSLRHTQWWNSTYTNITFEIEGTGNYKVGLAPKKSDSGDSRERPKATRGCWEGEDTFTKTFEIIDDSKSSIRIRWCL